MAEEIQAESAVSEASAPEGGAVGNGKAAAGSEKRAHRSQKVGVITSDKMQKTVVVRVDRLVRHTKYRRYVRRTSKFMAHDDLGATVGDKVRIVETRPMSARKRWRVIEIVQKAAK
jgi:small subunit ribosomal protein S17